MSTTLFNVHDYGATGSGSVLDTPGVKAAIQAASSAGGGTVYFPAGTYLCFSIKLHSNVHLYLAQGCLILAAASPLPSQTTGQLGGTYNKAEPAGSWQAYQDFGHNHWHNSLIWAVGESNLGISGPGHIYGKGLAQGNTGPYKEDQTGVGNKAIALKNCSNVTLRDFSIRQGGHFGILLTGVQNVTIDNLTIDTNRDGMDIDCCKNVQVSNCRVNSPWDDGICLKSSYALGQLKVTENVTITNCVVTGCYELGTVLDGTFQKFAPGTGPIMFGRIKCGTESNGGFQRITISNCVFEGCYGLAIESVDGGICEDITITNITMRDLGAGPLFIRLGARLNGPPGTTVGVMRRILISNIVSSNSSHQLTNLLTGIPGYPIEDVKIDNFYMQHQGGGTAADAAIVVPEMVTGYPDPNAFGPLPAQGFYLRHIRHLEMSHVEIAPVVPDARPSLYLQDVNRAYFLAITTPRTPVVKPFSLNNIYDFHINSSQAVHDTSIPGSVVSEAI
jgi:polygalacturonase